MPDSSKKRVLFVVTKGNWGGAQRHVYDLATNLPKTKFEPSVAFGDQDGDILKKRLEEKGVRTIAIENLGREISIKEDFSALKKIVKIIKEERPDVLHLNSPKVGLLGALAASFLKFLNLFYINPPLPSPQIIFTSHGSPFKERGRKSISKLIYLIGSYTTVLISDVTIAVSHQTKKDIDWLPFISNKIKVVWNGVREFPMQDRNEARLKLGVEGEDKILVLSLSELHDNKGIDVGLRGIALLPPEIKGKIKYSVIGGGEKEKELKNLIEELGISDCVKLCGFIENGPSLLSGADLFLFPSRNENLPYAILEAGLAGLPIIATNVGGIGEIIEDMKDGILVHKEAPREIAEAITYLLENRERMEYFKEAIKKKIVKKFSLNKMVKETTSLFV